MQTKSLWYASPFRAELRDDVVAATGADEVRVRALHGALSRGTEALIFAGRVPESEYQRMRAPHMAGSFPFPVKYGYSVVGRVEHGPDALHGRTVFALHPHQSLFNLSAGAVVPLPENLPPQRAVLAANMETALNAMWDGAPGPGDRIAVVGAGVVGALVAYLCSGLPGVHVTLIDVDPSRRGLANTLGVDFTAPEHAYKDCDVVFHASGRAAGLATALSIAGDEARIVELSWYGTGDVTVPLGGAFHSRRLTIMSSQVGQVAPSHRPRWSHARRLAMALTLLEDATLDALIAPPIAFTDLPNKLSQVLAPGSGILCQRIDYQTAET